jgi:hypothetical protein
MPKKKPAEPSHSARTRGPEICAVCGRNIDQNNAGSIEHHANPKPHLPYVGGKRRPGWLKR